MRAFVVAAAIVLSVTAVQAQDGNPPAQLATCADLRDMDRAYISCTELIDSAPPADRKSLLDAYLNRGAISLQRRDFARATADFSHAHRIAPGEFEPVHWLGATAHLEGDHPRAIELYSAALALNPDAAGTRSNRATLYWAAGELERALSDRDETIRRNPNHSQSYLNRAMERAALGRIKPAMNDFSVAYKLKPGRQAERCLAAAILAGDQENRGLRPEIAADCKAPLPARKP